MPRTKKRMVWSSPTKSRMLASAWKQKSAIAVINTNNTMAKSQAKIISSVERMDNMGLIQLRVPNRIRGSNSMHVQHEPLPVAELDVLGYAALVPRVQQANERLKQQHYQQGGQHGPDSSRTTLVDGFKLIR